MVDLSVFKVMIVDDVEANIDVLVNTLGELYDVRVAMDGESALEDIMEDPPDLVLLDIVMPGLNGYEVCENLKSHNLTKGIPVIFLTAMNEEKDEARGLALGAVDYITKPFSPELVKARVKNHLELKRHRDNLEELVKERTRELTLTQEVTISSLSSLAETRDPETGGHILRTQRYIRALARKLQNHPKYRGFLDEKTIEFIFISAPLHDIGKVGVPDHILLKPVKLTDEEFKVMQNHVILGYDILRLAEAKLGKNSFMTFAKDIAFTHQEKWDGTGYPRGLKGEDIPVVGRLMAIADVYDALISKRVYKPPFPHAKAVSTMLKGRGTHFDPDMIDAFLEIEEEFRKIALEFADFAEERKMLALNSKGHIPLYGEDHEEN